MTHIIEQEPPKEGWLLTKKTIAAGDTVIFQDGAKETSVKITNSTTGTGEGAYKGLMKGYSVVGWLPLE